MRPGFFAILVFVSTLAQGSAPGTWPWRFSSDINTAMKQPEPARVVADPGWERLKAGMIGGFIGGGVGLVLGSAAGALGAGTGSGADAGPATPRPSPVVAGVAVGAVVGGLGALLFPGAGTPSLAVRSEPSSAENQALVLDFCLVSLGF
jgi:hypothetical protein